MVVIHVTERFWHTSARYDDRNKTDKSGACSLCARKCPLDPWVRPTSKIILIILVFAYVPTACALLSKMPSERHSLLPPPPRLHTHSRNPRLILRRRGRILFWPAELGPAATAGSQVNLSATAALHVRATLDVTTVLANFLNSR